MSSKINTEQDSPKIVPPSENSPEASKSDVKPDQISAGDRDDYIDPDTLPEDSSILAENPPASNASKYSRHTENRESPWRLN